MRRRLALLGLTLCAGTSAASLAPACALAATAGGTDPAAAPALPTTPVSGGVTGGSAPTGVAPKSPVGGATGGNRYGQRFEIPPVVRSFRASPRTATWGGGVPTVLRFRVDSVNAKHVRLRLTAHRAGGGTVTVNLGRRATNRLLTVRWKRARIDPGTYSLSLTVVDSHGRALARAARAAHIVVRPQPKPQADPSPAPAPSSGSGVFPVAGAHSWGEGFGVDRGDHMHQGQDLPATEGTPLVAPSASTVFATGYSASGSGEYVVLWDAGANRSYVYFHLHRGSTAVSEGQSVHAGQRVGLVGTTGHSTGPHLHFELWVGRWFDGGHAVDPAPFLHSLER